MTGKEIVRKWIEIHCVDALKLGDLADAIDAAIAAEREACACLAEESDLCTEEYVCDTGTRAAESIRARGVQS